MKTYQTYGISKEIQRNSKKNTEHTVFFALSAPKKNAPKQPFLATLALFQAKFYQKPQYLGLFFASGSQLSGATLIVRT